MNVLITGGARGLGLSLTTLFLSKGDTVVAAVRNKNSSSLQSLSDKYGEKLMIVPMDLSSSDSVKEAASLLLKRNIKLDCIINNTSVLEGKFQTLEELSLEEVENSMKINLIGTMAVVKCFFPLMKDAEKKTIINISSEAGSVSSAQAISYSYCISKTGVNMFTNILRNEKDKKDCRIYAIHPGRMKTDMGGAHRTLLPEETAEGVRKIICNEIAVEENKWFIDYTGKTMDW